MGYSGRVGLTRKKKSGRVTGQPVFALGKKKSGSGQVFFEWSRVGLENSDPYCHVYSNHVNLPISHKGLGVGLSIVHRGTAF